MQHIGLRNGVIGGLLVVAYFGLLYKLGVSYFIQPGYQWAVLLLYAALLLVTAMQDGRQYGFGRDFRVKVRTPFMAFVVANVLYWLFYYSLHLADPSLMEAITAKNIAFLKAQLTQGTGDPSASAKIREQIAYLESEGMSLPLGHVLMQMSYSAIGGFGLAALAVSLAPALQHQTRG